MADILYEQEFSDEKALKYLEDIEKQLLATGKAADKMGQDVSNAITGVVDEETLLLKTVKEEAAAEEARAAKRAENAKKFAQQEAESAKRHEDYLANLDKEAQKTAEVAKQVTAAQTANKKWAGAIKETVAGQTLGGKSLSEWGQQFRAFIGRVGEAATKIPGVSAAARGLGVALKATGIGLIISLVAGAITAFKSFQPVIDKVSQVTAGFSAVVGVLAERVYLLGSAFVKVFSGDFSGAANDAVASVTGIGSALVDAAVHAYDLEQRFQSLRDTIIRNSIINAQQQRDLAKVDAALGNVNLTIAQQMKLEKERGSITADIAKRNLEAAKTDLQLKQEAADAAELDGEKQAAAREAQIALLDAEQEVIKSTTDAENKQRELRKQASDERKKQLEAESKALEKLTKDLDTLRAATQPEGLDRDLAEVEKKYNALQRTAAEGVETLQKIEARRTLTPEELAQQKELAQIQVDLEEQRLAALLEVLNEYAEKDFEIEDNLRKSKEALRLKDYDTAVKTLETAKALREQELAILEENFAGFRATLEANGVKETEISKRKEDQDRIIQQARLESELQFQQSLLEIAKVGDKEQVKQIENTILLIQEKLATISKGQNGEKPKSFLESLGLTPEGIKGLDEAKNQILSALSSIADARVKEAEAATEAADRKVQAAEDAYAKERELAAQGLANDSDLRKQQLEEAKKQREAALKEEAKARRSQILLDSVGQLSSLATASANIFKALSPIPFAGIPLAIATIGIMFGAFAKAKADALKAASVPKFRKGTKLEGRSHEAGGLAISDEHGNIVGEAEGNEWLIGTKPSREHDTFLKRLNQGEFEGVNLDRVFRPSASNPITDAAPRIARIEQQRREMEQGQHTAALESAYYRAAEKIVQAIEEKEVVTPLTNYRVTKRRGRNTYTKIVKEEK